MKKILVATDGSDHAVRAVELASDLAGKYDAELIILHVTSSRPLSVAERHMAEVEFAEQVGQYVTENLADVATGYGNLLRSQPILRYHSEVDQIIHRVVGERVVESAKTIAHSKGITEVQTILEAGDPTTVIIETAKKTNANLIVLGSRGLGAVQGALLGSVSSKVNHLSDINVITVK